MRLICTGNDHDHKSCEDTSICWGALDLGHKASQEALCISEQCGKYTRIPLNHLEERVLKIVNATWPVDGCIEKMALVRIYQYGPRVCSHPGRVSGEKKAGHILWRITVGGARVRGARILAR